MFEVGECVVYTPDGSRGIVVEVRGGLYHIVWEDHTVSWENGHLLRKEESP